MPVKSCCFILDLAIINYIMCGMKSTYLSRQQLQEIDRIATRRYGISSLLLMENAGRCVADGTIKLARALKKKSANIIVICGNGNNGGDGFVAARHLCNTAHKIIIFYLGELSSNSGRSEATEINLNIVRKIGIPIIELPWLLWRRGDTNHEQKAKYKASLSFLKNTDIILDAIFGIGLERQIEEPLRRFIEEINLLKKPVIAVDVPSGLDCDTGIPLGIAVKATMTVTFGFPKIGFRNKISNQYTGKVVVADISIPKFALR
jgi:NAD(P)H-hydrate epimerase